METAKVLLKSTSCFRIIFSPWRSEFAYVCLSVELAFESKLIVFMNKTGCKQSLRNRNINHWVGKRTWVNPCDREKESEV